MALSSIPPPSAPPARPALPGGLGPPGQMPFGGAPMTSPLKQEGMEAAGYAQLSVAINLLTKILPMFGVMHPTGQAIMSALKLLSKDMPHGTVSPGMEQTAMQKLMEQARQQGPQIAAMRAGGGLGGAAPPGGMMPPPSGGP